MTGLPERIYTKEEAAEKLRCKVSYLEELARTRRIGSYLTSELVFSDQHLADYLAGVERKPGGDCESVEQQAPEPKPPSVPKARRSIPPPPEKGVVPLRARPERSRAYGRSA